MRGVGLSLVMALSLWQGAAMAQSLALPGSGPSGGRFSSPFMSPRQAGLKLHPTMPLPIQPSAVAGGDPSQQCLAAIAIAERTHALPSGLLAAIGRIETGRRGADGRVAPWPFSINAEGVDHVYKTKAEVIAAVRALQQGGTRSIDVGCLQINLMHHPDAFGSLEDAFDPMHNAQYAADFLVQLHNQTGSWTAATADYHSATPDLGGPYAAKVDATWAAEGGRPDQAAAMPGMIPSGLAVRSGGLATRTGGLAAGAGSFAARTGGAFPFRASGLTRTGALLWAPTYNAAANAAAPASTVAQNAGRIGAMPMPGRTLAAYRLTPVRIVSAPPLP